MLVVHAPTTTRYVHSFSADCSVAGELDKHRSGTKAGQAVVGADRMAAFNKQYSASSPQSEDELDTPGPLEPTANASSSVLESNRQEHADAARGNFSGEISSLWASAQPLVKTLAPAALLLVAFSWLVSKLRRKPHKQHQQPEQAIEQQLVEPEPTLSVYASDFTVEPNSASPRVAQLAGVRCAVAEHVAVQVRD